ncbi:MAG: two-partner secretion domain-containing protein, partial [Burkholderiales bacterium]
MQRCYRGLRNHWRQRTALAVAVAACFAGNVLANPTGPAVVHGQATITAQGNTLTVTNAPGTVINWQGFSIAGNEIARFIQQSQFSSVLNRVVGINPSVLLGALQSNGRVFLVNPNGITIGPGAHIDVAGFLASTLNLSDADFLAGRMRFTQTPGAGGVANHGTINTSTGGMVYLVGQDVQNSGIIRSPQGEILLAAGKSVELVDAQMPEVRVQLTAPDNQALNLGQLIADGGRIGMYGTLIRHSGVASANTAVLGENGRIVVKAVKDVTLDAG